MTPRLEARISRLEAVTAGAKALSRLTEEELEIVILDISRRLAATSESPEEREELARNIAQAEDRPRPGMLECDGLDECLIIERSAAILARLDMQRLLARIGGNET